MKEATAIKISTASQNVIFFDKDSFKGLYAESSQNLNASSQTTKVSANFHLNLAFALYKSNLDLQI